MRLTMETRNRLVDEMAGLLAGGELVLSSPDVQLVRIPLPGFGPAVSGIAVSEDLPDTVIQQSGDATTAMLVSADGIAIADLVVRAQDAEDVKTADVVLDRTDFQYGGICRVQAILLTIPDSVRPL